MPEYLAPGVYVEEIATGPVPIEGVSTSTAGFVGLSERGPSEPRLVTSWIDFQRWYGGLSDPDTLGSFLPHSIRGFFDNGGQRAFVTRITRNDAVPSVVVLPTAAQNLNLASLGDGDLNDRLYAWVGPASKQDPANPGNPDPARFRIILLYYRTMPPQPLVDPLFAAHVVHSNRRDPDVIEDFDDLEFDPLGSDYVISVLRRSTLVTAAYDNAAAPERPANTGGGGPAAKVYLPAANGNNGAAPLAPNDYLGTPPTSTSAGSGLNGLAAIDPISMLVVPDEAHAGLPVGVGGSIRDEVILQCEQLKDRFAILQLPVDEGNGDPSMVQPPSSTSYAAVYYPWVRIIDPVTNENYVVPPGGHVAGVYARTDIERGVHKAPANAVVRGIVTTDLPGNRAPLSVTVSKQQQDILNPRGVNVIRDFRPDGRGIRVWGARTMAANAQWKYVNVRRLFIFLEESVDEGTQWVVFEPNDEQTWARVRRSITNFLTSVWRSGALVGATAAEAFSVTCDRTTMTQDDIDNGRLICYIAVAPSKPAEFVIFRFSQKTIEAS